MKLVRKCMDCGKECNKIGSVNKIGVIKSYCCQCFAKIDPNFISEYWCGECTHRLIDPFHKIRAEENNRKFSTIAQR